jgi:hypothetical protein
MKLAERFQQSQGAPVEVDGELVHMLYDLPPVEAPASLRIGLRPTGERAQALNVSARNGKVVVNGQALTDIALWTDTAPPEVVAELQPAGGAKPMTVQVWNGWRDSRDVAEAWIGDAGMVVEDHGDGRVTLRCSDGYDRPSFDDLVVELALEPAG